MEKNWKFSRFGVLVLFLLYQNLDFCWSLNDEGLALLKFKERVVSDPYGALVNWKDEDGVIDACSWFGVECADGRVVALKLKDLCLGGTLAPELRNLVHIKSIVLRNNSFTGIIPKGFGELKELEVLDLGFNNFSGPLPPDLGINLSLAILLLDNNGLPSSLSPEIDQLKMLSEFQVDENLLSIAEKGLSCNQRSNTGNVARTKDAVHVRQLQGTRKQIPSSPLPKSSPFNRYLRPLPAPRPANSSPNATFTPHMNDPTTKASSAPPTQMPNATSPSVNGSASPPLSAPTLSPSNTSSSSKHQGAIIGGAMGGILLIFSVIGIYLCKTKKAAVKPWATGLSGQLQKAFVTGVPKLKRSELEAACEDFSNVIGPSPMGRLYKGTLSSGIEIAVASVAVTSAKEWSKNFEVQFRKKIEMLSKVNHKNFDNLLGYCEEEEPFTRMLVFEYAPNGTLFEHLHYKESEHLDWGMRLRIAAGIAYSLGHMHQLNPPIPHNNLNSSAVRLTEDYAAKISDFSFLNETSTTEIEPSSKKLLDMPLPLLETDVYNFGVLLFEMVTGRLPYSVDNGSLEDWAADYMNGDQPLGEMVDPTLDSYEEEKLDRIGELIKSCVHPDHKQRPTMTEVTARLREITVIAPDAAIPKLSPLWWAELEILSAEAN